MTNDHIEYIYCPDQQFLWYKGRARSLTTVVPHRHHNFSFSVPSDINPSSFKNQWIVLWQFICSVAEHTEQAVSAGLKVCLLRCVRYNVLSFVNSLLTVLMAAGLKALDRGPLEVAALQ